jgi:hypothetical protein
MTEPTMDATATGGPGPAAVGAAVEGSNGSAGAPVDRDPALVLAGLHLRLGSLALARAELETLAASGGLDHPGRVDLAEVRWRTGDLIGAGEMARQTLASGDESVVALVVAAESAAALGRPTESRRLATQAQARMAGPIDPIFAGMPRSGVWPADPAEPVPSPTTLFPPDRASPGNGLAGESAGRGGRASGRTSTGSEERAERGSAMDEDSDRDATHPRSIGSGAPSPEAIASAAAAAAAVERQGPGFWDDLPGSEATTEAAAPPDIAIPREPTPPEGLEPAAILDAGEAALLAGDYASAALHLGLVVRVAPSIAPAVLAAIGDTPDAGLQMVRGDAYRVLGREVDARRAYEAAMTAAGESEALPPPSAIHIDRWVPTAADASPAPVARPAEDDDEVAPPPFLLSRPWPGLGGRSSASAPDDGGTKVPHEDEPEAAAPHDDALGDEPGDDDPFDADDDRDPFAGEP